MKILFKPGVANMAKWRATRDATSNEKCNKMKNKKRKRDWTKSANYGASLEL